MGSCGNHKQKGHAMTRPYRSHMSRASCHKKRAYSYPRHKMMAEGTSAYQRLQERCEGKFPDRAEQIMRLLIDGKDARFTQRCNVSTRKYPEFTKVRPCKSGLERVDGKCPKNPDAPKRKPAARMTAEQLYDFCTAKGNVLPEPKNGRSARFVNRRCDTTYRGMRKTENEKYIIAAKTAAKKALKKKRSDAERARLEQIKQRVKEFNQNLALDKEVGRVSKKVKRILVEKKVKGEKVPKTASALFKELQMKQALASESRMQMQQRADLNYGISEGDTERRMQFLEGLTEQEKKLLADARSKRRRRQKGGEPTRRSTRIR